VAAQKIVLIGTGGTIAGVGASATDHTAYVAAQLGVDRLVEDVAGLEQAAGGWLHIEQLAQLDSKDMDADTLRRLAVRVAELLDDAQVRGVVITHGTDTLEETAFFLQTLLAPVKPVVLTCAMRPATALGADGPQNLLDAVTVARQPDVQGVLVVCAGRVHGPLDVQKVHPYRLDAFSSGDAGPLAHVEEGHLRVLRPWPAGRRLPTLWQALSRPWPRVAIVSSHAEATDWMVPALVGAGAQGLVVACTGNGTVHRALDAALRQAQREGVRVVRASRCPEGALSVGPGDAIRGLPGLSPVKARMALMLELMQGGA
jgi:L-asparaginase